MQEVLKETEKFIKTEFAFAHTPDDSGDTQELLTSNNWKSVGVALNWHKYHKGDRPIYLFYKKFKGVADHWEEGHHLYPGFRVNNRNTVFKFGCGGRLLDGMNDVKALRRVDPKPLTLLRVSKTEIIPKLTETWLSHMKYRWIDSTSLANYYINGSKPTEYSEEQERAFWQGWETRKQVLSLSRVQNPDEF
jgi:hypothetical protein